MWEIDLADQIASFLMSIPLGAALAMLFFTFDAILKALDASKLSVWINDILFFIAAGFITFCFFLLRSNGEIRGYILFGEGVGVWLFKVALSRVYVKFLVWIIRHLRGFLRSVLNAFEELFTKIAALAEKLLKNLKIIRKKG